jgi:type IV secretion system protein VirD4
MAQEEIHVTAFPEPPIVTHIHQALAYYHAHPWQIYAGGGALMTALITAKVLQHRRQSTSWGSARWATRRECQRAGLFTGHGIVLGRMGHRYIRQSTGHVAVFGPSQPKIAGKTRAVIVPTLLSYPGSVIALDVKGELEAITGRYRRLIGPVYRFNPLSHTGQRMNVLDLIRWGTRDEVGDVQRLCEQIRMPEAPPTEATHYRSTQGRDVLETVFLLLKDHVTERSFGGAFRFLSKPLTQAIADLSSSADPLVRDGAERLKNLPANERGTVWGGASERLMLWKDPLIDYHTSGLDVPLATFQAGARPQTLFLQFSAEDLTGRHRVLARLLWQSILSLMIEQSITGQRRPLLVVLDECAALGYMPPIEVLFQLGAGYKIQAIGAFQSPTQLKVYGDKSAIFSNCAARVIMAQNDGDVAALFSQLLGTSTVQEQSTSHAVGQGTRVSDNVHQRPLLTSGEIMEIGPMDLIIRASGGLKPIRAKKIRYTQDHPFAQRAVA